ncbi:MAG: hypothetical protein A2700_01270 [Candidatus Blackburnbacteria bacterium RIFCSPHIGHO2_01_FULL_44_64]|uniref:L,D-TPase catalytic domain-containing protein n=1 Tax=Candidatus Blackburnbacteria bacterium RIFCSPHIGHO2_02_FULL_44_20 TaxID=1797516 RepID=A0A1G1V6J7_9BACT|nr:MAG: hypothetical protein A2700_01270 [Candidatus Blackburnbacteria bacterium RIFCSPHIGHO2_01_FULL_44_64]OGY10714.1 MAG: hypothetical protein A3E16_01805 [Candidatus Blackburnbacteria bacterium RIFCSPHIGHO2_12_FULL_44_25]OGY11016.1 MAG: hypothetical protein A3D26_03815 [Candidatus Blackburnbacteria bacterium RIFCSPHIGHO2_02_FULL_44_20]OGY15210.1 MAG: hypothetical protein A3A62_02565 [Candidatus Blackburnbacteria bacterium RIFCSPLOWO2_01_FULL_44_43]OGY15846.1 MAG: hypothetical protein A3H88_0
MPKAKRAHSAGFGFTAILLFVLVAVSFFAFTSTRTPCANSLSCKESLQLRIENDQVATFGGQTITPPKVDLSEADSPKKVLAETSGGDGEKHIYVDLGTQTLTAYEGETVFMQTPISSGKWGKTPTGDFKIWETLRATKMSGGSGNDYYYLPNVPYVMFFSNDKVAPGRGFALHGAYWHNNFGHTMSHGCVNMRIVDAEKLYYWVHPVAERNVNVATKDDPGTLITIYGESSN